MHHSKPLVSVVIPCYNHEQFVQDSIQSVIDQTYYNIELIIIDDGSKDNTLAEMIKLYEAHPKEVKIIDFSRNFGKEGAFLAGLRATKGDYVTVMDADLQDDINAVDKMIEQYQMGIDIVYGVRSSRKKDTFISSKSILCITFFY